jgi:hypothetical protein
MLTDAFWPGTPSTPARHKPSPVDAAECIETLVIPTVSAPSLSGVLRGELGNARPKDEKYRPTLHCGSKANLLASICKHPTQHPWFPALLLILRFWCGLQLACMGPTGSRRCEIPASAITRYRFIYLGSAEVISPVECCGYLFWPPALRDLAPRVTIVENQCRAPACDGFSSCLQHARSRNLA